MPSALTKAHQWQEWLDWRAEDHAPPPWGRFLWDVTEALHAFWLLTAKVLRKGAGWDGKGGTEREWMRLKPQAEQLLWRYRSQKPSEIRHGAPWLKRLDEALEGALRQAVRVGGEVDEARDAYGLTCVNIADESPTP